MKNNKVSNDPKLEAIKEIIFGDNIKRYDKEFMQLRELIEHQRKEFDDTVKLVKTEFFDAFDGLKKELKADVKLLKKETIKTIQKVDKDNTLDKKQIGKMFEDIGKKLQS